MSVVVVTETWTYVSYRAYVNLLKASQATLPKTDYAASFQLKIEF